MDIRIREGTPADAEICGRICYDAFKTISEAHGFASDFPAPEVPIGLLTSMLANPKFYGVVAEIDGRVVGSNFLDERNSIAGVGPITVDPAVQNCAVGRRLMDAVHDRAAANNFAGVRLIQAGFHTRSLALYAKLGYDVREHLACMQGNALNIAIEGHVVRPAAERTSTPAIACVGRCTGTTATESCATRSREAPRRLWSMMDGLPVTRRSLVSLGTPWARQTRM